MHAQNLQEIQMLKFMVLFLRRSRIAKRQLDASISMGFDLTKRRGQLICDCLPSPTLFLRTKNNSSELRHKRPSGQLSVKISLGS